MHKARWRAITKSRLQKFEVDPVYIQNPLNWPRAIVFEVNNYGSDLAHRQYLMRRWHKRILGLKGTIYESYIFIYLDNLSCALAMKARRYVSVGS